MGIFVVSTLCVCLVFVIVMGSMRLFNSSSNNSNTNLKKEIEELKSMIKSLQKEVYALKNDPVNRLFDN